MKQLNTEERTIYQTCTLKEGYIVPNIGNCLECGKVYQPVAFFLGDGTGWYLIGYACDCEEIRHTEYKHDWPFNEKTASFDDFEKTGFFTQVGQ